MSYLYETHLHTAEGSACAVSRARDYIKPYKNAGYSGIIVTDHFYNGNSALPRSIPWRMWVNRFCRGYEEAKEEGYRQGLDVFFGWEETFEGSDDYLIYGLDKEWLLEHPESKNWTRAEQYRAVKEAGGVVVQAHPFRQHDHIRKIVLSACCVDGVEAANRANCSRACDTLAFNYAKKINKTAIAGTDIHCADYVNKDDIFGVYLEKKLDNIADFAVLIRSNKIAGLKVNLDQFNFQGCQKITIPVSIRDENDRVISKNWQDFAGFC